MEEESTAQPPALVGEIVLTHTLPSGGTVVFRDPVELRAKHRREVLENVANPDRKVASGLDMVDGAICMLVQSWTIPYEPLEGAPLPKTDPSLLGELSIADKMYLDDAVKPAMDVLFPPKTTPENAGEPGSPTKPA